jgi:phage shock protein PspC (stress-responsive transcriptional regulator)
MTTILAVVLSAAFGLMCLSVAAYILVSVIEDGVRRIERDTNEWNRALDR